MTKRFTTYKQTLVDDINGVRPVMIPDEDGEWISLHEAEHQLKMSYREEFIDACRTLGAITNTLGIDEDKATGNPSEIFDAIEKLKSRSAEVAVPDDLIMLIRKLVHSLKKSCPDHRLVKSVPDYMARMGCWQASDCLRLNSGGKQ